MAIGREATSPRVVVAEASPHLCLGVVDGGVHLTGNRARFIDNTDGAASGAGATHAPLHREPICWRQDTIRSVSIVAMKRLQASRDGAAACTDDDWR